MSAVFRLPAFAKTAAGEDLPEVVPQLPRDPSELQRNVWYGIRCAKYFADIPAMIAGERGFVHAVLKNSLRVYMVQCAVKEPLLLVFDVNPGRTNLNPPSVVQFLQPSTTKSIPIAGLSKTYDFIVQQLRPQERSEFDADDVVHWDNFCSKITPFKGYNVLSLSPDEVEDRQGVMLPKWMPSSYALIPLEAITSSMYKGRMVTLLATKSSSAQKILSGIDNDYTCFMCQSANSVRLMSLVPFERSEIKLLASLDGVMRVSLDFDNTVEWHPRDTAKGPDQGQRQLEPRKATKKELIIKKTNGAAVTTETAHQICLALQLKFQGLKNGALFALAETDERGEALHEAVLAGEFAVASRGLM